jgi:uncharacterized membrane protein YphA (DoxX/SURF4 family)
MNPVLSVLSSLWLYRAARVVLGGLFLVAGVIKLTDPQQLAVVIDAFGLVPRGLVMPVAYVLPVVEIVAGAGLMFDFRGSLKTIAVLTVVFLAVLGYGLHLGLDIDCGCYGPGDPEAEAFGGLRVAFYRDLIMLAGILYCYWWRRFVNGRVLS